MHLASPSGPLEVSAAARACPPATGTPSPYDLMLDGLATRFVDGFPAGAPTLQRALSEFSRTETEGLADLAMAWVWLAVELWDADAWFELGTRQVQAARDAGALTVLPLALHTIAAWHSLAGDLALADTLLAEADSIMAATGDAPMSHARLRLAALQGGDAEALITASIQRRDRAGRGRPGPARRGRGGHAVRRPRPLRRRAGLGAARGRAQPPRLLHDRVAGAGGGRGSLRRARRGPPARSTRSARRREASGTAWARGVEARSRALISEGDDADALYREAISLLAESRLGVESARAQLLYGEWLRRQNRRVDAREQLRAAHEAFAAMGAEPFAERAERELKATGETVRKRSVETRDELTPQEAQIARLAAERLTNAEIAAQLFLSPRTVEWHLRKVFRKLGISSRRQLRSALPDGRAAAVPV